MSKRDLLIFGAGRHGLVVAESAASEGWTVRGFLDDRAPAGTKVGTWAVLDPSCASDAGCHLMVAIGDNADRREVLRRLTDEDRQLASVIHPSATLSGSARIGRSVFVGPAAVVNAAARLDDGVIVNSGAVVEHDCHLHACVHAAPRCALAGGVEVRESSLIGLGATVLPNVRIGRAVTVGSGAAVVTDVGDGEVVVGVPARRRER